ncbi:MAG: hypothetical protein QOG80_79, partial [Pseudonocardiales bacterium]|nr:hypothetical protein [Pseudonocardiales bacterium]
MPVNSMALRKFWRRSTTVFTQTRVRLRSYDSPVSLEWEQTVVDARDPGALGRWWQAALRW